MITLLLVESDRKKQIIHYYYSLLFQSTQRNPLLLFTTFSFNTKESIITIHYFGNIRQGLHEFSPVGHVDMFGRGSRVKG
jgi:hypothetical protein